MQYSLQKRSSIIPIFVEIQVRIQKATMRNCLEYPYKVRPQSIDSIENNFSKFEYYDDLLFNYHIYLDFIETKEYQHQLYQSKLETDWIAASPYDLQTDISRVYVDASIHSSIVIETSSLKRSGPKVYS